MFYLDVSHPILDHDSVLIALAERKSMSTVHPTQRRNHIRKDIARHPTAAHTRIGTHEREATWVVMHVVTAITYS